MMRPAVAILSALALAVSAWADGTFTETVSPADAKAAGLDRLSPAERKRLDELIQAFQSGKLEEARRAAAEALAAKKTAEAEAKAAKAEVADAKKNNQGFFQKAKVLLVPGTRIEYAVIKTTIVGKFNGWGDHTVFQLANGQTWQIANSGESFFTPPKENVEVEISPAVLGGFWMNVPIVRAQVRVKLVSTN